MDLSRHVETVNPEKYEKPVHVIGCGATGSWVALTLTKMGFKNINLWDFDVVDEHNIPNQVFHNGHRNKSKVEALAEELNKQHVDDMKLVVHNEKVTGKTKLEGIVFLLTDTMASRKEIFEDSLKYNASVDLIIETRMGKDTGMVYTIDPNDISQVTPYEATLSYSDDEAETSFCGISTTLLPTALQIVGAACWRLINHLNGEEFPNEMISGYGQPSVYVNKFDYNPFI